MQDLKVVAKGSQSIVLASQTTGKAYKCIPHSSDSCKPQCSYLQCEYGTLAKIQNPNIVSAHSITHFKGGKMETQTREVNKKRRSGNGMPVEMIMQFISETEGYDSIPSMGILELDLMHCDYLDYLKLKPPVLSRISIFRDVVEAVGHLHNVQKLAHNDLRLPNIFIRKMKSSRQQQQQCQYEGEEFFNCSGVLGDFGLCGQSSDIFACMVPSHLSPEALSFKQLSRPLQTGSDSESQPPSTQSTSDGEFQEFQPKQVQKRGVDHLKNDVFQLGVSLFEGVFGLLPYKDAKLRKNDKWFQKFYSGNLEEFWCYSALHKQLKQIKKGTNKDFVTSLKDLLYNMLNPNQKLRFDINQVQGHKLFTFLPGMCQEWQQKQQQQH